MQTVDVSQLRNMLQNETAADALVIDVRTPAEYRRENIVGVVNMPLDKIDEYVDDLRDYKHVYVHCASGNRSQQACQKLNTLGLNNIVNVTGGISAWKDAGFHTKENKSAPLPIMQQVQIAAGSLVLLGVLLSAFVTPYFVLLSAFVGAGLVFAGFSGTCTMGLILSRAPWNRRTA
jgi:rhodanese-related sulfurtransferase